MSRKKFVSNCMKAEEFIKGYKEKFMKPHEQIPIEIHAELYGLYFKIDPHSLNTKGVDRIHRAYHNYLMEELTLSNLEMICRNGNQQ